MKTIFDKETTNGLIARINLLQAGDLAQWGKMDAWQMLKHCTMSEEMYKHTDHHLRQFGK